MFRLSDFDFDLPDSAIALRPTEPREAARLLAVPQSGPMQDCRISDFPSYLRAGDVLVVNDSWVTPAALTATRGPREDGGSTVTIAVNLLERLSPAEWSCFARPAKRLRPGDILNFGSQLLATVLTRNEALATLRFALSGAALAEAIQHLGSAPLPPYILAKRHADAQDLTDYQTAYADPQSRHCSVAAPTAGLHLTRSLLRQLDRQGVRIAPITLGVGAGTFLPVKSDEIDAHVMHPEAFAVGETAARQVNEAKASGARVIAVGTTSLRALESCTWDHGRLAPTEGSTQLFIKPGYRFRSADGLMTNFHLPRSTLFMLVCAFAGFERMHAAYRHAITNDYRFFSYGDASLLWRSSLA